MLMEPADVEVVAVTRVGPNTIALELETPPGFDARPGQFVLVRATVDGEPVARHYTLSSPDTHGTFEITVGIDPEGTMTPWLDTLDPGAHLRIEGPFGRIYYEHEDALVVVAGGPGVGAAVGMGERAIADGGAVSIVYRDETPAHEDRLAALAAAGATVFIVNDGLDDAIADVVDAGQVYVFGFRGFIADVLAAIEAAGGDPDAAKLENFGYR